jgi:hypothetical protein
VAQVTRRQLDRAFMKLVRLVELKDALEARAAYDEPPAEATSARFHLASAIAADTVRPVQALSDIFRAYIESLSVTAGPHVRLSCPDGQPLPEPLRAVLHRAASEFERPVEVISGYRSLAYNRLVYRNRRRRRGEYLGDRSQHIHCRAVDIRMAGVSTEALHAWALRQPELGGIGRYRTDFIHIDVGPRPDGRVVTWERRTTRTYARRHQRHLHNHRRYARA